MNGAHNPHFCATSPRCERDYHAAMVEALGEVGHGRHQAAVVASSNVSFPQFDRCGLRPRIAEYDNPQKEKWREPKTNFRHYGNHPTPSPNTPTESVGEWPINEPAFPDHIFLGQIAPVARVSTVECIITHRQVMVWPNQVLTPFVKEIRG